MTETIKDGNIIEIETATIKQEIKKEDLLAQKAEIEKLLALFEE